MRIRAAIRGDLERHLREELGRGEGAAMRALRRASRGLRDELRGQIRSAGLGNRLANTVRAEVYPKAGASLGAAALVFTRAPRIIRAFEEGAVIRSRSGFWLAIPTENAPRRGVGGGRINPSNFPEHRFGPLRFVYRPGKPALLVVDEVRIGRTGRVGRRAANARTKSGALRSGLTTVVMFVLVPRVRLKKRLDWDGPARRWLDRLPAMIVNEWRD